MFYLNLYHSQVGKSNNSFFANFSQMSMLVCLFALFPVIPIVLQFSYLCSIFGKPAFNSTYCMHSKQQP